MGRSSRPTSRTKNMNVKFTETEYKEIQDVVDSLGGMPMSSAVRMILLDRLKKVKETGNPKAFIEDP